MGGMGGGMGGMGGMGGGMGGMGGMGGGMGGMGGGFRSVPTTGLPHAALQPNQTRHLPTRLVSLTGPGADGRVMTPEKGEGLQIGEIGELTKDRWTQAALMRLAERKAPPSVAQLVMWNVTDGFDWPTVARLSHEWANGYELSLARRLTEDLRALSDGEELSPDESGAIHWEITSRGIEADALAAELKNVLPERAMLGLRNALGIPAQPDGPSLAVRVRLDAESALLQVSASDANASKWAPIGKVGFKFSEGDGTRKEPEQVADLLAEKLLGRLVDVRLEKVSSRTQSKPMYRLRLINASPLILNGVALSGTSSATDVELSTLAGFTIPPHRDHAFPASAEMIDRLGLKSGVRVMAADLSGL
jgi:hypothetical protein